MTRRRAAALPLAALLMLGLTACSLDVLIWGRDGAEVKEVTRQLIRDMTDGGTSGLVCPGADVDLGESADWAGRSAGEPEVYRQGAWEEHAALDPQWSINIELEPAEVTPGVAYPSDVFYRQESEGLCVVAVARGVYQE